MPTPEEVSAGCRFDGSVPGCSLIHLFGELDACSVGVVEQQIDAGLSSGLPGTLVLDLGDVEFIDSTGIRLLIQVLHRCKGEGRVVFVNPKERVARRALEVVGFGQVASMVERIEDAIPS